MSGGIKYRLTAKERALLAEQLGVFEDLRARLKPSAIDAKLDDVELEVSVEEGPQGPEFTLEVPFDTDLIPQNGRIYVKDVFKLSQSADRILAFERSLRQDLSANKKVRYWIEAARKDHPNAKGLRDGDHLKRFLEDLQQVPKPALEGAPLQRLLGGVLGKLHRPFPEGNESLVRKNFEVFRPVLEKTSVFGMRMKFGDPQSGLSLRREDNKLFLSVQVVLDSDSTPGLESEKNGRMYLIDTYQIEEASGRILGTQREIVPSEVQVSAFQQAYAAAKEIPAPDKDFPELQVLVRGWLEKLSPAPKEATTQTPASVPSVTEAPEDPAAKILFSLYRFTERDAAAGKKFLETMTQGQQTGSPLPNKLGTIPELDRAALHDALAIAIQGDAAKAESTIAAWLEVKPPLEPTTQTLLDALSQYTHGNWEAARSTLQPLTATSPFARRIRQAVELKMQQPVRLHATEILKTAAAEWVEKVNRHDRAWLESLSNGIAGNIPADPELRRVSVLSFFKNFEATLRSHEGDLTSALETTPAQGLYEKELKSFLLSDPTLKQLTALLDERDAALRESQLLSFARGTLLPKGNLPATAKRIAEGLSPDLQGVPQLNNWFQGKATLGQKVEMLLPAFVEEVTAPRTLLSMMVGGTLGQIAKASFYGRAGYQTQRLRWAAEAISVGVEAPAFVLTEKLIVSATDSPVGQWEKLPRDTLGALLAFGTLRGAGIASRRFQRFLADSKGFQAWAEGRSQMAWAERWRPAVAQFAEAEGKQLWFRRATGKTAVPLLEYLGTTGLPRAWTKQALPHLSSHAMGLGGLMAANSLTRLLGLRDPSQQGLSGDLVDDFLMYGHFLVAGHLASRLGRGELDARIAYLEAQPVQAKPAKNGAPEKIPEKGPTAELDPATPPKFDVPPEVQAFGRSVLKLLREELPRLGSEWYQSLRARLGKGEAPASTPPASGKPPKAVEEPTSEATPAEGPEGAPKSSKPPSQPPPSSNIPLESTPAPASSPGAFLEAMPEAVLFRRIETQPAKRGKGQEFKVFVEVLGREEELRFGEKETKKELLFEAVLGREDIQNPPQAEGINFGFPSTESMVAPQHAKLRVKITYDTKLEPPKYKSEGRVPQAKVKSWEFSLEDMNSPGGTLLNGKPITGTARLKDQDLIRLGGGPELRLRLDPAEPKAFLIRPPIALGGGREAWILGREHGGAELPDIRFPMSDRDMSRKHARILRDEAGRYFLQDLSYNGTRVNMRRLHGSHELRDGDSIQFGNGTELTFTLPPGAKHLEPLAPEGLPLHPHAATPPPEQAQVHPSYRHLSREELEAFIFRVGVEENDSSAFRAAQLALPDGRHLLLSSLQTAWAIGHEGPTPAKVQAVMADLPPAASRNPALIYLDGEGRFILKGMKAESVLSLQTRPEKFLPPQGEPKNPSQKKQNVSGWTVLEGGERVFLGEDFFFDFWPSAPKSPYARSAPPLEVTPQAPAAVQETATSPTPAKPSTLAFLDGKLQLPLNKSVKISSRTDVSELLLRDEAGRPELEILVPESVAKLQETRFFQEDGTWKIRSEGGDGQAVIVNGMELPPKLTLDLLPDTTLQIGDLKIKIHLP